MSRPGVVERTERAGGVPALRPDAHPTTDIATSDDVTRLVRRFYQAAIPDPVYRALYARLEHLERDTHRHIHLENNVLFPAAVALEGTEP